LEQHHFVITKRKGLTRGRFSTKLAN